MCTVPLLPLKCSFFVDLYTSGSSVLLLRWFLLSVLYSSGIAISVLLFNQLEHLPLQYCFFAGYYCSHVATLVLLLHSIFFNCHFSLLLYLWILGVVTFSGSPSPACYGHLSLVISVCIFTGLYCYDIATSVSCTFLALWLQCSIASELTCSVLALPYCEFIVVFFCGFYWYGLAKAVMLLDWFVLTRSFVSLWFLHWIVRLWCCHCIVCLH